MTGTHGADGPTKPGPPSLNRAMGLRDVTLFIVTAGTNLQWVAAAAAAGPSSLVVWVFGALVMFLPLSVCIVFLSSRYPDQGGLYVWSKHAFGPFVGFMTGWTYWTSNLPYFPSLLYFAAGSALFWSGRHDAAASAPPTYFIAFALAALIAAVVLNVRGLRVAKWLSNLGAVTRWLSVILLIVVGIATWRRFGAATAINRHTMVPGLRLTDIIFWSMIAFAWTGPEAASFMGGEIRNPQRTVPRALGIAAPMIAAIYLLGTISVLLSIPAGQTNSLYGVMQAMSSGAARLGIPWLIPIGAACVSLACLGGVCAWLGAVARIPFVAGIDRYLPRSFARLHPRYGSPTLAIVTQAVIAGAFAFLGQAGTSVRGAYAVFVNMAVVAVMLPFLPLFGAAIKLSGTTSVSGEVRIPGGRATVVGMALIGLATTVGAIFLAFVPPADDQHPAVAVLKVAGMTAAILVGGAAIYFTGRARGRLTSP